MGTPQDHRILGPLQRVAAVRARRDSDADLAQHLLGLKTLQTRRFRGTYGDLLTNSRHGPAARFFLQELYGERDYSERDRQFERIASAIEKIFPDAVVDTAGELAALHALSEELDLSMALALQSRQGDFPGQPPGMPSARDYIAAWRQVGEREERGRQLEAVLGLGRQLDRLTRKPALRVALRMMRGPARAAGLTQLQQFLETGFDTFARLGGAEEFLGLIESRETIWLGRLFDKDLVACETALESCLGQAP